MSQAASRGIPIDDLSETGTDRSLVAKAGQKNDLHGVYHPVATDLAAVERILQTELRSDTPWVARLLEQNWIGGGKRVRPVFLLLSGAACGQLDDAHLNLAAAVEMIHCATLVHDDVLDNAATRRHQPTVNAKWDNRTSVLLGDYLFTHSFYVASLAGSAPVMKILARSSNKVCEGEIRQNACQGNFDLSEADYLAMIADKTAELCGCSCRIGAILSAASDETCLEFESFGRKLGIAFQIIDDVLDVVGEQDRVGKTLGTDLVNQKPTLPVIHSLKNANDTDRARLISMLESGTARVEQVLTLLNQTGSVQYARSVARDHAHEALLFAKSLPATPYSESLQQLAKFVHQRTH